MSHRFVGLLVVLAAALPWASRPAAGQTARISPLIERLE